MRLSTSILGIYLKFLVIYGRNFLQMLNKGLEITFSTLVLEGRLPERIFPLKRNHFKSKIHRTQPSNFKGYVGFKAGQIIATSHDLTPNGGLVREIPLFQGNLGW